MIRSNRIAIIPKTKSVYNSDSKKSTDPVATIIIDKNQSYSNGYTTEPNLTVTIQRLKKKKKNPMA